MNEIQKFELKKLKESYINGIKELLEGFFIALVILSYLGSLAFFTMALPLIMMLNIFTNVWTAIYFIPLFFVIGLFLGYTWWWICKYLIQPKLPKWVPVEL